MHIVVTGANGFVGTALARTLAVRPNVHVLAVSRTLPSGLGAQVRFRSLDSVLDGRDGKLIAEPGGVIVHTAGRAHVTREKSRNSLQEFRQVNVEMSLQLARRAATAGIGRFIYLSSVKVNGENAESACPFTADDTPAPQDAYGVSKMEAEQALREFVSHTNMELVIIRPPLVYGPGVKANFRTLLRMVNLGIPLPLGAVDNKRSFIGLDNLIDLIVACIEHPAAANQTFLASDTEDLSTPELLRRIGVALGRPARILRVPQSILELGARFTGTGDTLKRLCASLCVDPSKVQQQLGWTPPFSFDAGLLRTAQGFLNETRR